QLLPSTLSLLVFLIRTNDADDAAAPHHFAFVANPFHRRSHLHLGYLEFTDSTSRQFVPASHPSTARSAPDRRPPRGRSCDPGDRQCARSPLRRPRASPDTARSAAAR